MGQKLKTKFCSVCGLKMKLIPRQGQISYIDFESEKYYYSKLFNTKTGKLLRLYVCPNFGVIEGGWFERDRLNSHNQYTESE